MRRRDINGTAGPILCDGQERLGGKILRGSPFGASRTSNPSKLLPHGVIEGTYENLSRDPGSSLGEEEHAHRCDLIYSCRGAMTICRQPVRYTTFGLCLGAHLHPPSDREG